LIDGGIVTKWAALAIKMLLTDNKSVSKANYSAEDGFETTTSDKEARKKRCATASLGQGGL
jgi:hypothetical protein